MAFSSTRMLMAAGNTNVPPVFTVYASNFGGSNYIKTPNSYAGGSGTTGIISMWVNFSVLSAAQYIIFLPTAGGNFLRVRYSNNGPGIDITLNDGSGNSNDWLYANSLTTGVWYNLLFSWNSTGSPGSQIMNFYLNNVQQTTTPSGSGGTISLPYNNPYAIAGTSSDFTGCVSEVYFAPNQFLDFTVSGNRAKFYNSGAPVYLGSDGSAPTGTQPAIYWKGNSADLTNLGSMGSSFTQVGGSITACGSIP
jgi:hypothetical protein